MISSAYFKQINFSEALIKFICKSFLNFGFATMNAQSSLHIIVQESIKNDTVTIKFKTNFGIAIRPLKIPLIEGNMAEQYSKELYNYFIELNLQEPCFLVIINPLPCEVDERFNFLAQLAVDTILKLLNLKIIPVVIANMGDIEEEAPHHSNSILYTFIRLSQQLLSGGQVDQNSYEAARSDFQETYRIHLLNYHTLQNVGHDAAQPLTDKIIYCPSKELIYLKTHLNIQIFNELEDLREPIQKGLQHPR